MDSLSDKELAYCGIVSGLKPYQKKIIEDYFDVKFKDFIQERVFDATRLLGLFNAGNLTSVDLREHRQKIKDEAGDALIHSPSSVNREDTPEESMQGKTSRFSSSSGTHGQSKTRGGGRGARSSSQLTTDNARCTNSDRIYISDEMKEKFEKEQKNLGEEDNQGCGKIFYVGRFQHFCQKAYLCPKCGSDNQGCQNHDWIISKEKFCRKCGLVFDNHSPHNPGKNSEGTLRGCDKTDNANKGKKNNGRPRN